MEFGQIDDLLTRNKPFKIETDAGRTFDIPHRSFVCFSRKRTSMCVLYEENGEERFAILPLPTITSAKVKE